MLLFITTEEEKIMEKASRCTCQKNQQMMDTLPFDSNSELALAQQNCVAAFDKLEIKQDDKIIWSQKAY